MANRPIHSWRDRPAEVRAAQAGLARRVMLSRLALGAERAARAFWPLWTLVFTLAALVMFGVPSLLPARAVQALLVISGLIALSMLLSGLRRFRWPRRHEAEDRLDEDLSNRPLAAMNDAQVLGLKDPASLRVWSVHLKRMAEAAGKARVRAPDLRLAALDPLALRLAGITALIAALLFAPWHGVGALQAALKPPPGAVQAATGPVFEAWASPPAYTGKPALYLSELVGKGVIDLPEGTGITVRAYGGAGSVRLEETLSGTGASAFTQSAEGIQDAAFAAVQDGELHLTADDGTSAEWQFRVIADAPPAIRLSEPVSRAASGAMDLRYAATDDHGIEEAWAEIRLDLDAVERRFGLEPQPRSREPLVVTLPLPVTGGRADIAETLTEDLSEHPWAGLPVIITLHARDGAGQVAESVNAVPALPSRRFFDPMAASFVEQRRDLLWSEVNGQRVWQVLKSLTWYPEDIFTDHSAYLLARIGIRRLGNALAGGLGDEETTDIADLLWHVALLIEDGDLSDAAERLRRAQDRLAEALKDGATDQELAQLMDELRDATQDYLQQMAREAMERGMDQQAQNQQGQTITPDQLQQMLDKIQELAENGQNEEAQKLLEQLQQLMENMQMTMQQGKQGEGQQTLEELQDMLKQQQDLADDAFRELQDQFRQGQQGQQGQQQGQNTQPGEDGQTPGEGMVPGPGASPGELADRQEALRRLLEDLRSAMPGSNSDEGAGASDALRDAERNMGEAGKNLDQGNLGDALDRQADAMEALREGMRDLIDDMQRQAQSQGRQPGQDGTEQSQDQTGKRDPLGRPTGTTGSTQTDESMLPADEALKRAREILDEIRRRAGEQMRPKIELDYLKRLLDQF